jgi:CubicO group peptidase (beta-lactamase class C family)
MKRFAWLAVWLSMYLPSPLSLATDGAPLVGEVDRTDDSSGLKIALEEVRSKFKLPALAGGIVTRDGLQELATVGVRKLGTEVAATDQDLWHLGSCTKAMTATLLATLVQQGQLSWDSKLADSFPELRDDMRQITLEHLLTHRSGLPANGPWRDLGSERSPTQQRLELLRLMSKQTLRYEPGSHYEYSNVGYALAGLMAEQVTGESWEVLMQQRVFAPLKMDAVGFGSAGAEGQIEQPWGHVPTLLGLGPLRPIQGDNAAALGPAGTVHASFDSWGKFIALHLQRNNALLQAETWDRLHLPADGGEYAMGWIVVERDWAKDASGQGMALNHAGSNTMNYCVCWLSPQRGTAMIAATNSGQNNAAEALDKVCVLLGKRIESREAAQAARQQK